MVYLDLDFLGKIRLVNYIRSQVKAGNLKPDVSSASLFEDELYMMPVLEDDALLYSLDDISGEEQSDSSVAAEGKGQETDKRVLELQEELDRLQGQFADYRSAVKRSMDKDLEKKEQGLPESEEGESNKVRAEESNYFTSYAYNSMWNAAFIPCNMIWLTTLQLYTSLCLRIACEPTRTETLFIIISAFSKIRLFSMLGAERAFCLCSVRKQGPNRSSLLIIRILLKELVKLSMTTGLET